MFILASNGQNVVKVNVEEGQTPTEALHAFNESLHPGVEEYRVHKIVEVNKPE